MAVLLMTGVLSPFFGLIDVVPDDVAVVLIPVIDHEVLGKHRKQEHKRPDAEEPEPGPAQT
jgi:hypothetical protein